MERFTVGERGAEVIVTERGGDVAPVVVSRQSEAKQRLEAVRGQLLRGEVDVPLGDDDWDAAR